MLLIPENHRSSQESHDPYTEYGARNILRRNHADAWAMLDVMLENHHKFPPRGVTMLKHSPLRKKIYIAAALKTLGYIEELETRTGACALCLTASGLEIATNGE